MTNKRAGPYKRYEVLKKSDRVLIPLEIKEFSNSTFTKGNAVINIVRHSNKIFCVAHFE